MGRYLQNKKLWSVLTNTFELKLNFHWGVEKSHKFISLWGLFFYLYLNLISAVSQLSLLSHIFKDTHREEALSSKTPALAKSMIMGIWVIGTSNQLFIRGICHTETKVPSFFKKAFVFSKNCFKVEILKTFKISSDYHIKTCRSLKRRAILVFRSTYVHSVSFKMKSMRSWRQSVFLCLDKNQLKFCRKIIGKTFVAAIVVAKVGATVDFLSIWWIN